MTRFFDTYGDQRCCMCHRHPRIGWVYRCTQDHGGSLPESDFVPGLRDGPTITSSGDGALDGLAPGIAQAVRIGHYTPEQIDTVKSQRLAVKRAIAALEEQQLKSTSRTKKCGSTTLKQSTITSTHVELDTSPSTVAEEGRIKETESRKPSTISDAAVARRSITNPTCQWRSCHNCRPTFRDRTWLSLDAVLADEVSQAPEWEMNNRRISDLHCVRGLGTHSLHHARRSLGDGLDHRNHEPSMQAVIEDASEAGTGLSEGNDPLGDRGRQLRDSLRNLTDRLRPCSRGSRSPKRSTDHSGSRVSQKLKEWARCSRDPFRGRGLENRADSRESILVDAINTPLPGSANDAEDLEGGEVEVEDGLAVKEEGVGLSAADIIVQG